MCSWSCWLRSPRLVSEDRTRLLPKLLLLLLRLLHVLLGMQPQRHCYCCYRRCCGHLARYESGLGAEGW